MSSPASWHTLCSSFCTPSGREKGLMKRRCPVCSRGSDWFGKMRGLHALAWLFNGEVTV